MVSPKFTPVEGVARTHDAFIGRDVELRRIAELFASPSARLVTLDGPAGVGKTRLAIEVLARIARDRTRDVFIVRLATTSDERAIVVGLARALQIADRPDLLAAIADATSGRSAVALLDNVEQIPGAGTAIAQILRACPAMAVLVTSRRRLLTDGEVVVAIESLAVPATNASSDVIESSSAIRLFVDRARRFDSDFEPRPRDLRAIASICAKVDGLPLAIELSAAWIRVLTPTEIAAHLDQGLDPLRRLSRSVDGHHQTLRTAIGRSYNLLDPIAQELLRRLAIFNGGFSLEFAKHLAAGRTAGKGFPFADGFGLTYPFHSAVGFDPSDSDHSWYSPNSAPPLAPLDVDVEQGISALVEANLVRVRAGVDGTTRYDMLATIREFGLEQLVAAGERAAVELGHAALILAFAEAASLGIWARP